MKTGGAFTVSVSAWLATGMLALVTAKADPSDALPEVPTSPGHPWHSRDEGQFENEAKSLRDSPNSIDTTRTYSLAELIDLGEMHNPETRANWEHVRSQAANLGIARSELFPTLAAAALSQINRGDAFSGSFHPQTAAEIEGGLDLNYTIFDFGARAGRINAAKAEVLSADFEFNDTHRQVIYRVERAYYRLLNAAGQIDAAEASLTNALTVQQAAEDRLQHGLTTLPDVLESRSAAAQAQYELQAVTGGEVIARADLAKALGSSPTFAIHVQPLDQLTTPDSLADTVEKELDRACAQRPDLMKQLAGLRSAKARVKEARAAYFPILGINGSVAGQSLHATQQGYAWEHTRDVAAGAGLSLTLPIFDGGLRRSKLARAKADVQESEAQVKATRDSVANEVWTAYSNLQTAFRQRQSATALLEAANQSYAAALESYEHGVRNLLDVTAAQRTLAQARSTDVYARTEVLSALAELAFRTASSIQSPTRKAQP